MATDGFSFVDKVERNSNSSSDCARTVMVDQYDHYHPFPSCGLGGGDGDGPTRYINRCISSDIYDVVVAGGGGGAPGGAADGLRTLQPFDISPSQTAITAFKSPGEKKIKNPSFFTSRYFSKSENRSSLFLIIREKESELIEDTVDMYKFQE